MATFPHRSVNIFALAMFLPGDLRLSRANYRGKERKMRDTIEAYRGEEVWHFFSYIRRGRAFMLQLPKQRKQLRKITRESKRKAWTFVLCSWYSARIRDN